MPPKYKKTQQNCIDLKKKLKVLNISKSKYKKYFNFSPQVGDK